MKTPILDFVKQYREAKESRFHMPGHKGKSFLGMEDMDITEIDGADVLYSADGIIKESEDNLSSLFGTAHSFYSAEGSTLVIKAMLTLVSQNKNGERPLILAGRNAHKAFIYGAALLDLDGIPLTGVRMIVPESVIIIISIVSSTAAIPVRSPLFSVRL